MKTLKRLLFFITGIVLLIACSKSDRFWSDEPLGRNPKGGPAQPVMVTVPFEVELIGEYVGTYFRGQPEFIQCENENPEYFAHFYVDAEGKATHMGKITAHFSFCGFLPNDDPTISVTYGTYPGISTTYGTGESYFVAANGDKLFTYGWGKVIVGRLPDHPEYVIEYWRDPFIITGGTGRFEGASGGGMTDDYNSALDPYVHVHWRGTITLVKGKR